MYEILISGQRTRGCNMNQINIIKETSKITGIYAIVNNEIIADLIISNETISGSQYNNSEFRNVIFMNCNFQSTEITDCEIIDCTFVGDADFEVLGMNEIHVVTPGDIVFVDHPKYYDKALNSAATIVLINKNVDCPKGKALLISDDPFRDFNKLTTFFKPFTSANVAISSSAKIGELSKQG